MFLWLFVGLVVLSATYLVFLAVGPLHKTPLVRTLWIFAGVQYLAAIVAIAARLAGRA
ncbi:hypothetical protein [Deinococcus yavapaiensis]|uniref:Uncharacterized protein n=1 Tax=Deinococcus yavapaiensis KR-236 TaxID=694435 RepID=A0A318S6S1_9DEIO|nr:hypothetical protein [Deinococcus yavapaiensis]PYE53339.1 hypothetical protein DES52_109113 [Deinococcus yavapaiensis KR-236]